MLIFHKSIIAFFKTALIIILLTATSWLVFSYNSATRLELKPIALRLDANVAKVQNIVREPKIFGLDSHNNPFSIVASSAQYQEDAVYMQNINAMIYLDDAAASQIKAKNGVANISKKEIILNDDVQIICPDGETLSTSSVLLEYSAGVVSGDTPVLITSKQSTVQANSFRIYNNHGKRVVKFGGAVQANLNIEK